MYKAVERFRIRRKRFLSIAGGVVGFLFVWKVSLPCLLSLTPLGMRDELQQTATSLDGRYTARLWYRNGLTFGYGHVTIEEGGWHPLGYGRADLVEVAAEGLVSVRWRDVKTLVVGYDATKNRDPDVDTYFVSKPTVWQTIRIVYLPEE